MILRFSSKTQAIVSRSELPFFKAYSGNTECTVSKKAQKFAILVCKYESGPRSQCRSARSPEAIPSRMDGLKLLSPDDLEILDLRRSLKEQIAAIERHRSQVGIDAEQSSQNYEIAAD
jgi:hypothetical protein